MIYFIRDPKANRVKIGYSADPWARFSKIQTDCSATLILEAAIEGGREEEAALHELFRTRHERGEWFVWSGPVARYVVGLESVLRQVPPPKRRDARKSQINRAIFAMGFGSSFASQLQGGQRFWTVPLMVGVWKHSGHTVGPLEGATDEEMTVFAKFFPMASAKKSEAA